MFVHKFKELKAEVIAHILQRGRTMLRVREDIAVTQNH